MVENVPTSSAVEFLHTLKLKSRASFLLILAFIRPKPRDYTMPVLKNLLGKLSPNGDQFFDKYIYGDYKGVQFICVVDSFTDYYANLYIQNIIG